MSTLIRVGFMGVNLRKSLPKGRLLQFERMALLPDFDSLLWLLVELVALLEAKRFVELRHIRHDSNHPIMAW